MKTIGQILKNARVKKKYSLAKLEDLTKIRKEFIDSIEKENWENLPAFPTIFGFVKSISAPLGLDERTASATLKRDYPPKDLTISPKPDISSKFTWTPKLTFALGIGVVILSILGYLIFQYSRFTSAPSLKVESPKEGQVVSGNAVLVFGSTDSDAKVIINNQPVLVDADGKFSVSIEVVSETKEIITKAISRSGKETVVSRKIVVQ